MLQAVEQIGVLWTVVSAALFVEHLKQQQQVVGALV